MDEPVDSDDLIIFQNSFKELGRKASTSLNFHYSSESENSEDTSGSMTMGDIVARVLEPLDLDITFLTKKIIKGTPAAV